MQQFHTKARPGHRSIAFLALTLAGAAPAAAHEPYPFEGAWSDMDNQCKDAPNLQLRYGRKGSQSDSGSCTFRSVKKQGNTYVLSVDCDEADNRFRATERITVEGDRMTRSRKVPWSAETFTVSFMRCDAPQASTTAAAEQPAATVKASGALPKPVAAWVSLVATTCKQDGGKGTPGNHVRTADFNGDGQPDYLVDDNLFQCQGASVLSCGSGGCSVEVFLSGLKGYKPAGLDLLAESSEIQTGGKLPVAVIETRGGTFRFGWNGKALVKGK